MLVKQASTTGKECTRCYLRVFLPVCRGGASTPQEGTLPTLVKFKRVDTEPYQAIGNKQKGNFPANEKNVVIVLMLQNGIR